MRRSLGEKRRELTDSHCSHIVSLYQAFAESDLSKIYDSTTFGYRRIVVERPLRCSYQATPRRITAICEQLNMSALVQGSTRRQKWNGTPQDLLRAFLDGLPDRLYRSKDAWVHDLERVAHAFGFSLSPRLQEAILGAFSERDEEAEICCARNGHPQPDAQLRDTERVPRSESVWSFFDREVVPYVPDAWVNTQIRDGKDGQVSQVGYEINVPKLFYRYQPPRPLKAIMADIVALEADSALLLHEMLRAHEDDLS